MDLVDRTSVSTTRATLREDWALVASGAILLLGVFADGWAHSNILDELESFITPWHSIIFAGYLVSVGVVFWAIRRRLPETGSIFASIPAGWRAAVGGVGVFALGFLGDGVWHTIYGIEADLEALLSPTHLLMFVGAISLGAAPVMSAWGRHTGRSTSWREHGPVFAAMTIITGGIAFFFLWAWHIGNGFMTEGFMEAVRDEGEFLIDATTVWAIAGFVLTIAWMAGPLLFLLRRWQPPVGAASAMILIPTVLLGAVQEFAAWPRLLAVLAAVVFAEWWIYRFRPGPGRPLTVRLLVLGFGLVSFGLDMAILDIRWGLAWPPEFVAGSVLFATLFALGLSYLAFPPAIPDATHGAGPADSAGDRGEHSSSSV